METDCEWAAMSNHQLESEVRGLAARVAAAMCRFLLAVAEYDARRGFEDWECHDMAHWLVWKCGITPVTAREYVRVGRALRQYCLVRDRFAAGALSYSQTRAICRAVTPATEAMLVDWAAVSTAAQLEKITRAFRRCRQTANQAANDSDARRYLRFGWDDDGNLTGTFCLPAEAGAAFIKAVEDRVGHHSVTDAERDGARDPYSAARADALTELVVAAAGAPDPEGTGALITVIADQAVLDDSDTAGSSDAGDTAESGVAEIVDGPGLAAQTVQRLACDATTVTVAQDPQGNPLHLGRRTRRISRRLRHALKIRDGNCQWPGCSRQGSQAHHIHHWAHGGPTNLDNLVSLCWRHHRRLHEGGYSIRRDPAGGWTFTNPHGLDLPALIAPARPDQVTATWGEPNPYEDGWDGTRLDLPVAVDCLLVEELGTEAFLASIG